MPATLTAALALAFSAPAGGQQPAFEAAFDCGYQSPEQVRAAIRAAVAAGQIADPAARVLPRLPSQRPPGAQPDPRGGVPVVTAADIVPFEDSASILTTNFSNGQLFDLMAQASNAVLAAHGDEFDFIGFFLNFTPDHTIGSAFYLGLENDTTGLGLDFFNNRPGLGVGGSNLEGWVMMWNQASWGPNNTTMLVLGQEFEHRWAMFLDPLLDGRILQGTSGCGRGSHWNWKVDGQGSGMEIREWVGSNPATLGGVCAPAGFFFICFNSDIGFSPGGLGGVWSYTDLYLMGYVSPGEMDAGNSELRYMNTSDCSSPYNGTITTFDSSDIIAANGVRDPDSTGSQHDFRTAWVMFHLPGAPPNEAQLNNVVNILNRWTETWEWSTLGRGTMDNTLHRAFAISFPNGTPTSLVPDQSETFDVLTTNISGAPDTDSGLLHYAVDGGPESTAPLAFLGGDSFQATLPGFPCGSTVRFYVSIDALGGGTEFAPAGAPDVTLQARSVELVVVQDDFEVDQGWTVVNSGGLTDGAWTRGVPAGGGTRGDPDSDFDGSGQCWLTDNAPGNSDVDNGTTTLVSPVLDLSGLDDPFVSFARWYSNSTGDSPFADTFVVEVSDDGGTSWTNLETVGPTPNDPNPEVVGGWFVKLYRIADAVSITNQFRIRFSASDLGPGSIVEAAVDAFAIFECPVPCPSHDGDMNGDLVTNADDIQPFVEDVVTGATDPASLCPGDFDDSGTIDPGDVPGMVTVLLAP